MNIRMRLAGVAALAVIGGVGLAAPTASAAPAAPASHSAVQKAQTIVPPKRPTSGTSAATCPLISVQNNVAHHNCGGSYRNATPTGNSITVAADGFVYLSNNYRQNIQASDFKSTIGAKVSFYCYNAITNTSTAAKWTKTGVYHLTGADMQALGMSGCPEDNNEGIIFVVTGPACGTTYVTNVYVGATPDDQSVTGNSNRGAYPWRVCTT